MRKAFLISVILLSVYYRLFPQTSITLLCDDTWGPGRYNKVTITINLSDYYDFARFSQDMPVGLNVIIDDSGNGDFNWVNNQLNLVWMKFPENRKLTFSYFVLPDKSMNGSFTITGRFSAVSGGTNLRTSLMKEKRLSIEGINGILPEQMKVGAKKSPAGNPFKKQDNQAIETDGDIIFMVQVSVSSKKISDSELIEKLGLDQNTDVRVLPSGKMYKYQAGSFSTYDSAGKLLKEIIAKGYKDAFIVAYRGGQQIRVEKALESLK
jgi:hypothetical protein